MTRSLALVGGRGYVGGELLTLLARHPELELSLATSSTRAGRPIGEEVEAWRDRPETFGTLEPEGVSAVAADVWVLSLPNGRAGLWAAAIRRAHPAAVILDVSADHRFTSEWSYGLPELWRERIQGQNRIANPGCYATGIQLGVAPLRDLLHAPPVVFGVSGFSGAGRTPSPRNNPERLRENLLPYSLTAHLHEREAEHHLGRPIRFSPHVAPFFRGISLTVSVELGHGTDPDELYELFRTAYRGEQRVWVSPSVPEIQDIRGTPDAGIGGFAVDPRLPNRAAFVVVLDNLLKGAASQALQNVNLALGMDESLGVDPNQEVKP